jgi:pimeloyl-ACP methyl ester carboxylesterase
MQAVPAAIVEQHRAGIPHAQVREMDNARHAPFWDDATTFNQHLRALCESLLQGASDKPARSVLER